MEHNLRHLRVFMTVVAPASVTRAAEECHVSQPAVTQALNKLEQTIGAPLFKRTPQGLFTNDLGRIFARRAERAFVHLDTVTATLAPRLRLTATAAQLDALIAVREAENFTLAARRLGLSQPTVHRAVRQLEQEATRPLLERTSHGILATRAGQMPGWGSAIDLRRAGAGRHGGVRGDGARRRPDRDRRDAVVTLRRSAQGHRAVRAIRPRLPIRVLDGPYPDLPGGLRRGEIDFLIGALRDPLPIADVEQQPLFEDSLVLVGRPGHPLAEAPAGTLEDIAGFPCIVAAPGTPTPAHFDRLVAPLGDRVPTRIVESASLVLMRELLLGSDHVGCISRLQAEAEIARGLMVQLGFGLPGTSRPIGITTRVGWEPTPSQAEFLTLLQRQDGPL